MKRSKKLATLFRAKHLDAADDDIERGQKFTTAASDNASFPSGIKAWYEPQKDHLLDIVFVHGLTGDRERTWTHPDESTPWPKTVLPLFLSNARILTFGYDAYVALKKGPVSSSRLSDHSNNLLNTLVAWRQRPGQDKKPLIFVAHSLGGILCKDVLLSSHRSSDKGQQAITAATVGVIFMGTPHSGSALAKWAKIPASALGIVRSTNTHLLDVLETDNEVISRIQDGFLRLIKIRLKEKCQIELFCFYEDFPMGIFGKVVTKESAIIQGEDQNFIRADHRDMVRFRSDLNKEDAGRAIFLGVLLGWVENLPSGVRISEEKVENLKQRCLLSLAFPEINARKAGIDIPLDDTCQWIYENEHYQKWAGQKTTRPLESLLADEQLRLRESLDKPSRMLWIKGKPGSGKSTLMKALYEHHNRVLLESEWHCLAFFFNARGSQLEKTPSGLYRTLLVQLLRTSSEALHRLLPVLLEKDDITGSELFIWSDSELAEMFHSLISGEGKISAYVYVDAMDECNDTDVQKIVQDFDRSVHKANKVQTNLRICLSSRHYPQIRSKNAVELRLELMNAADIRTYIKQELVIDESKIYHEIEQLLVDKASGVFMWVVEVIRHLHTASERGCRSREIKSLVEALPTQIEDLFAQIVRAMDQRQLVTGRRLAQWVLGAYRPLRPEELHLVLALSEDPAPTTLKETSDHLHGGFDLGQFQKFVNFNTCGLFEVVSRSEISMVQFIHESVRDFLFSPAGLSIYGFTSRKDFEDVSREMIARAWQTYANLREIREAFFPCEGFSFASVDQLVRYTYEASLANQRVIMDHSISEYYIHYSIQHIEKSPWFLSEAGDKSPFEGPSVKIREPSTIFRQCLRRLLEAWLFTNSTTFTLDHYGKHSVETGWSVAADVGRGLDFWSTHCDLLGMSAGELGSLVACVNNRALLLRHLVLDQQTIRLSQDMDTEALYHLVFWNSSAAADTFNVVYEVESCASQERCKNRQLTAEQALELCKTTALGFAFLASFRVRAVRTALNMGASPCRDPPWSYRSGHPEYIDFPYRNHPFKDGTSADEATLGIHVQLTTTEITEDAEIAEQVTGCKLQGRSLPGAVPFHTSEDHGYISLLLRQNKSTCGQVSDLFTSQEVVAVAEKDTNKAWRSHKHPFLNPNISDLNEEAVFDSLRAEDGQGDPFRVWRALKHGHDGLPELSARNANIDNAAMDNWIIGSLPFPELYGSQFSNLLVGDGRWDMQSTGSPSSSVRSGRSCFL